MARLGRYSNRTSSTKQSNFEVRALGDVYFLKLFVEFDPSLTFRVEYLTSLTLLSEKDSWKACACELLQMADRGAVSDFGVRDLTPLFAMPVEGADPLLKYQVGKSRCISKRPWIII